MSGDTGFSGVATLHSDGVSAAESFSGEFDREASELSVLYASLYLVILLFLSILCSYIISFCA